MTESVRCYFCGKMMQQDYYENGKPFEIPLCGRVPCKVEAIERLRKGIYKKLGIESSEELRKEENEEEN